MKHGWEDLSPLEQHKIKEIPLVLGELDLMEQRTRQTLAQIEHLARHGIVSPDAAAELRSVSEGHLVQLGELRTGFLDAQHQWFKE